MTSLPYFFAALVLCFAGGALAQPAGGPPSGGPPPEAIAACKGKSDGAACSFVGRRSENLTGKCFTPPPRQSQSDGVGRGAMPMACRPANAPDGPPGQGGKPPQQR